MKAKLLVTSFTLIVLVAVTALSVAQRPSPQNARAAPTLLNQLPPANAVALVNVRQLLDQAMPKILGDNPAKLAEANAEIERFKTKTGIDPRSFDQLALGLMYTYPHEGISKIESIVLARGTYNAAAFVSAGRIAANGKYREEKYQGRTIYVFSLGEQMKVLGLFNLKINELAVSALANNLLAIGSPATVRLAIDAGKGRKDANRELIELAVKDPNAAIGFGGEVTPKLLNSLGVSNEAVVKDISTIRQVYGSVGVSEKDVEMFLAARTLNPEAAKSLSQTLEGLKQLGAFVVARMPAPKRTAAQTALDNLKITTQGSELQIRTAVPQVDLTAFVRSQ